MKPAEFTDYASATAFLMAGRKKNERATADGWNTVLKDTGLGVLVLELHGTPVVQYSAGGTEINIPMRNHVVADRIQRYGFADNFRLNVSAKAWSISQRWGQLPGINAMQDIWYPIVEQAPNTIVIDAAGTMVTPTLGAAMPTALTPADRKMIFDPAIKKWLSTAMKMLDAGYSFTGPEWSRCHLCLGFDDLESTALGAMANDTRHIMSHVLEGHVSPAFLRMLAHISWTHPSLGIEVDPLSGDGTMGAPHRRYNRSAVRTGMRRALRTLITR